MCDELDTGGAVPTPSSWGDWEVDAAPSVLEVEPASWSAQHNALRHALASDSERPADGAGRTDARAARRAKPADGRAPARLPRLQPPRGLVRREHCPTCGALPGHPCVGKRGRPRERHHAARVIAVDVRTA